MTRSGCRSIITKPREKRNFPEAVGYVILSIWSIHGVVLRIASISTLIHITKLRSMQLSHNEMAVNVKHMFLSSILVVCSGKSAHWLCTERKWINDARHTDNTSTRLIAVFAILCGQQFHCRMSATGLQSCIWRYRKKANE